MKTNFKSYIRAACNLFGGAICAAVILLVGFSAQAQNLFGGDGSGNIYEFTTNGTQSTFASGLNQPYGLAFNSVGILFEADYGSGNIYKFTPGGVKSTFTSGLSSPLGLAFDRSGNLFVASAAGDIYEFTTNGTQSTFVSGLNDPVGLAFDSVGNLFVASGGNIYEYTTNGTQSTFASGLTRPLGLAFDSSGNLFVSDQAVGNIYKFTPSGTTPLDYQWQNSAGAIPGATNSSLILNPALTNYSDNYSVIVSNPYGVTTSQVASVFVYLPVSIQMQPVSLAVPYSDSAMFDVIATGFPEPTSYQWTFNGTNLPGATSSSLTINRVGLADTGYYEVEVSNGYSSTNSQMATLNMSPSIISRRSAARQRFGVRVPQYLWAPLAMEH